MMDALARHHFQLAFRVKFLDARGDAFQKLFGRIMNLRYPGDFVQTRPWGPLGDDKCDGYLPSRRKFYQCYGPDELTKAKTLAKLKEDFAGALPRAERFFDTWVFVHNAKEGRIPTWLTLEIQALRYAHQEILIETLGYEELLQEVLKLDEGFLIDLFGPFPTHGDFLSLRFEDIKPVLNHVATVVPPPDTETRPVPARKLEYNLLGADSRELLRAGMRKAPLVRNYLDRHPDKELAAKVSTAFRKEYQAVKLKLSDPDRILYHLRVAVQGPYTQQSRQTVAAFAVLAYLFEECDIFERPPEA